MNAARILAMTDIIELRTATRAAWVAGNNTGQGFPAGAPDSDINSLSDELGDLVLPSCVDREPAVYVAPDDSVVLVGDANGPWAVRVR